MGAAKATAVDRIKNVKIDARNLGLDKSFFSLFEQENIFKTKRKEREE